MPEQARSAERPSEPQANGLTALLDFFFQVRIGYRSHLFDEVNMLAEIIALNGVGCRLRLSRNGTPRSMRDISPFLRKCVELLSGLRRLKIVP